MNKAMRKELEAIYAKLESIQTALEEFGFEEQEKFDNAPESLQETDRVLAFEAAADNLSSAADFISDAMEAIVESMN